MTATSYLVRRRKPSKREERARNEKHTRGKKYPFDLATLVPLPAKKRVFGTGRETGGKQECAVSLSLSLFRFPLKRKVSCVIKQRGCNVSSVQGRPYCHCCEAAGDDGVTEGLLPRANRSAEGCYRRRWKGEETGARGGGGGEGRNGQQGQEDAVSGTEDVGWTGDTRGEGIMICRVSRHAVRRLQPPFLVVGGCRLEGWREGGREIQKDLIRRTVSTGFHRLARSFPSRVFHPPLS